MNASDSPRPRAHVVGSLVAPDGAGDADAATTAAVALQRDLGFALPTDGELRRGFFFEALTGAIEGIAPPGPPPIPWYGDDPADDYDEELPISIGRLSANGATPAVDEARRLLELTSGPVKVTLPSPFFLAQLWHPEQSAAVYPDPMALFSAAADVLRTQAEQVAALPGVAQVQIDADELGVLVDPGVRASYARSGLDPERLATEGADLLASVVDGLGVSTALHMCRGNFRGLWMAAGDWEWLAERAFPRLGAFDTFLLEFDGPRCGSFVGLPHVPEAAQVVLGLVSTKAPALEDADRVAEAVVAASRYVPLERLGVSPAAGFAPAPEGNPLGTDDQRRKLELVSSVAQRVWG